MHYSMTQKKQLLLHTCCAPCLTAVNEKLNSIFDLTLFWYNPNIEPFSEHEKRLETLNDFAKTSKLKIDSFLYDYKLENKLWHEAVLNLENELEGGKRCQKCIEFRLKKTQELASGYESFTTTLTVSPHKNAEFINELGQKLDYDKFLIYDFKKANGYLRSIELSRQFGLYRQNYCGCDYSRKRKD